MNLLRFLESAAEEFIEEGTVTKTLLRQVKEHRETQSPKPETTTEADGTSVEREVIDTHGEEIP